MAASEFILQGFTTKTHIDALEQLFDLPDVQNILISVAFVSEGGVRQIETLLASHVAQATVFAGIRNDITSYQGLARLHRIVGHLYTVDTGYRTVIFHPKLYLVRGSVHARMVIGSANLTLAGLNNNIEAGMLLDFDLTNAADKAEIDKVEMLFSASLTDYPQNIIKISSIDVLDKMLGERRLIDEDECSSVPDQVESDDANHAYKSQHEVRHHTDDVPRIKLKTKPLRSGLAKEYPAPKEMENDEAPSGTSDPITLAVPDNGIEEERESAETSVFGGLTRTYRGKEGPRLRARRLKMEAKAQGRKWYFTGLPCRFGHVEDRLVSNGKCRECNRQDSERSNRLGLYR